MPSTGKGKVSAFREMLEESAHPRSPVGTQLHKNVNFGLERAENPDLLYTFQKPQNFNFKGKNAALSVAPARADGQSSNFVPQPRHPAGSADERDVELLRMIQKASRKPRHTPDTESVAPNDEVLIEKLKTAEDAIVFFSTHNSSTGVKYILLNRAPRQLEFRPYDLLVTSKGLENSEHYIMSCTGVVHVRPGRPSNVVTLADWMRESSLFNVLRKIPFFKHFLLYKAFFRWYKELRAKRYASTRKLLTKDFMLSKATFCTPGVELLKSAHDLTTASMVLYIPDGKHDYTVDEFHAQQATQRQKVASSYAAMMEHIESKMGKLIEMLERRADVPDLKTREALDQYLLVNAMPEGRDTASKRKMKSMLDAKAEQYRAMRELKRSMVEYSKLDTFIRLVDFMASENLFRTVLRTAQTFYNTLRDQGSEEVRNVGFQVLLQPTDEEMLFCPTEDVVQSVCVEVFSGGINVAASTKRLCEQKFFRAYFSKAPRVWSVGRALRDDARLCFLQEFTLRLVHCDFEQANARMVTYATALPHIHFLQKEWSAVEDQLREEFKEDAFSCLSLAKLYRRLQEAHDALRVLMASFVGNTLWINAARLKTEVEPRMHILREDIDSALRQTTKDSVWKLHTYFKQKSVLLNERPQVLADFAEYVAKFKEVMAEFPQIEASVAQAEALSDLMDRQQVEFVDDEDRQAKERTLGSNSTSSISLHILFDEARLHAEEFIEEMMPLHVDVLASEVANVEDECLGLQQILLGEEFVLLSTSPDSVLPYLASIEAKLGDIQSAETRLTRFAKLFDQKRINWNCLTQTQSLYQVRQEIWSLMDSFNKKMDYWFNCPLKELPTVEMEEQINAMMRTAAQITRTVQEKGIDDELAPHLLAELQAVRLNMPVIHDCGNKHMSTEHWDIVLKQMTGSAYLYHDDLNLRVLQERDIFHFKEVLAEQSGLATGEWKINNDLEVVKQIWDTIVFSTKPYKNRQGVFILEALDEVIQQLDDHQIELQTTRASRFVAPVRDKVEKWIHDLRLISDVIEEWVTLQKNWMYLEFIFSSDDIKEQLPEESDQFDTVDRLFRGLTSRANSVRNVFRICTEDGLLADLRRSNSHIDHIQKKLEDYLETKRIAFPRFYFLSNDELLSILSDVRNPQAVQPHLSKCFDSIASLILEGDEHPQILGMVSGEGEQVSFESPVYPVGNVEQWLNQIDLMMKASLLMHMRTTVEMYPKRKREEWFFDHAAQCIQAVDMIVWTNEVEEAITTHSLHAYHGAYQKQLLRMVDLVKRPLSKLERTLVCTLIVLDVHNRDIVQLLVERAVATLDDFNWSQQLRYYWETNKGVPGEMDVGIRHCNAHFWYGYEYLGNQPRLVITPLTDRAFLTCTSALGMNLGAAPQGPAGTGKTESVKDLGKALARQVVVFNCSDGINYKTMARMFAGLAQAGAWACFDEFNRIELEVLSAIAQQMLEITTALGQRLDRMIFDGHPIRLSTNFGVFITMNPGYAGRTELPDNLKALFRPICMMIPDYALIAEIMFYSEGFADARTLAQKMVQLYKLSSEQLSKQDHYDFGMRAVKSILVMAGALKRQNPDENEDMLLIRAMRDANVPKFLRDDTVLFMALVKDLFPHAVMENVQNELLVKYLRQQMEHDGLQVVDGMVMKTVQLYDTLVVRHGVMMVGKTYSGKTTTVRLVQEALTQIKMDGYDPEGHHPLFNRVHIHLLNPKSVTMGELYGEVDDITREWTDGILSDIARNVTRMAQTQPDRQWIVFDGPVDAIWIENMNTVLDDNKLLCLFNGERIKLPPTATFMFEVQDLAVASPATVSRCGMVYMESYYFDGHRGWTPIAQSLVDKLSAENPGVRGGRLMELMLALLPDTLDFIRTNCREWMHSSDAQLAVSCIELLNGFVKSYEDSSVWPRGAVRPIEEPEEEASPLDPFDLPADANDSYDAPEEFRRPAISAPTVPADEDVLFDMYFIMAFVWSVGGNLRDDARDRFSKFVKERFERVMPGRLPQQEDVSVYDYVVHRPSLSFITWNYLVPDFTYRKNVPYFELVVPTAETVALTTIMSVLVSCSQNVLVNGVTGTGKSLGVMNFMREVLHGDDPSGKWEYISTVLSAQTRSKDIEERLESKLYKVRSNVLGPTPGKRAVLFVDDLNMPALEKYGASPPIELLRQLITQGGFFDKHKSPATFKELHDVIFFAACGVPGGGRNEVTMRLTSRFHLLCQPTVSDASMRRIFGSILYGFLREWNDGPNLCMPLIEATKECYRRITSEKLPTPTRSHYTFNLRDFSKVIQGIMQVSPRSVEGRDAICRVFVHEVSRTFHDRLIDKEDRAWWWKTLSEVVVEKLGLSWDESYSDLLYGDYMRSDRSQYEEITDYEKVQEAFRGYQASFNMEYNKEVELVFFKDAINHISRICRVLRQPRGNALLVGMGGTGRQSLCKLAASICNLPIHEVAITRSFSIAEFRECLKAVLLVSGCHAKPVLFFMSDAQIVFETMLEDINNLLNTGEVPNLMQSEDVDQIVESVRPLATAAGKQETRNVIFSHFVSLCHDNVHVVLAMSPVGDQFRRRLRMFPSLVNCCTIDWFDQWPSDALASVASRVLCEVQMDDDLKSRLIELCVFIHLDAQDRSEEFYEELRRRNYMTPTSYLELLTCYRQLLAEQDKMVADQINRYQGGMDTLLSTQTMVDTMKEQLVQMQPKLLQAARDTEEIMAKVEKEQDSAEVVRKLCAQEEEVAGGIQREADDIRTECQVELDKAMPILKGAEDALAELRPDDIREVKSFQKPAARVVLVLQAVLTLLGETDLSWDRAKLVMGRMDFIKDLQNYKKDELTEKMVKSIQKYIANPDFQPEEVAKSSKACKSLSLWVLAINNYYEVVKIVRPKRKCLEEAEAKLAVASKALREAQGRLKEIEDKLSALRREMQENIDRKKVLEDDIDLTTVRLERAEQLMGGLASEQTRWIDSIASLTTEKSGHVGKMVLSAGFVAYLGPFTSQYRERMIASWHARCLELKIPVAEHAFILSSIVDPVAVRDWAQKGLPPDPFSVENGVIVTKSQRWCLCIDPQGQATNWIRSMERDNDLRVLKLSDPNYMRTLENAIRVGLPVLIENVEESLDAALDPVLLRQTYRSQGRVLIKVGDTEVDYDPHFRLYITTKLANPHYLPELQIKVTLVNFTVTQAGLENQLLADVVRFECDELEQRANRTITEIATGKNELKELEDKVLGLLASSTGNILDNEVLVNALHSAKAMSESVSQSLRVSEETQLDIEMARNRYRPVATRGATIYSVISVLSGLDHMYQHSLDFFKQLFVQTLQRTERRDNVDERVALLKPAVTLSSYNTICRGLFEKDKLTFAFLLYVHIARQRNEIRDEEWAFLLKGSEGRKYADEETDPPPLWLSIQAWNEVSALAVLVPHFGGLKDNIYDNDETWGAWYHSDKAYEVFPPFLQEYSPWQRLLVLKVLREDLFNYGLSLLISNSLGAAFIESPAFDLDGGFLNSTPTSPIIFVLTPGTDPTQLFTEFAERKGFGSRKFMLSLGQDQGRKAEEMIRGACKDGMWVYLQNCHVYTSWMPSLEHIMEELGHSDVHRDFRLWLTTMPSPAFPVVLLQSGVKLVKEPPKGLKANIRDTFVVEVTQDLWDSCPRNATTWRRLLFALTYFHAVIQERRKFGPLGWNIPYEWNQSDYAASLQSLSTYMVDEGEPVPWNALRYMISVINYGGRVTDFLDGRCLRTTLAVFFNGEVTKPERFNITADGVYFIPEDVTSLSEMKDYLSNLPPFESPELFGLHPNADITFNKTTVRRQLASILSVQPRSKAAAGASPEEKVLAIVTEFQRRLPPPINKASAHPETYRITDDGTMISLGTVASQEIDVFNAILRKLERTLIQLRRGIKGEVVMSVEYEAMFQSMLLGQVPQLWHDGGYLSRKPLASWFEDTLRRVEFFRDWNDNGMPTTFWISGFFFPQGFLTGILQTFSRKHRIPIDEVTFRTNVTQWEVPEDVDEPVEEGIYLHGLFMEGARYDLQQQCLMESQIRELHTQMPVIHLEPVRSTSVSESADTYACPVYKTSARVGTLSTTGLSTNYVVSLSLHSGEGVHPEHWIQRGVALLCMLDD